MGDTVVAAHGVTKWFGPTTALDGVDLAVGPGVIHGLLGPNGAGKTTLLAALFGLVLPDEGTLTLFGRERSAAGAAWLDRVGGFVETPRFYPYLSGRRNLAVLAALDGSGRAGEVDDVLALVGLDGAAGERVRGYSLGMRQRLGLAAALLRRPALLILDEPTNGMDPAGIRDLRTALRRAAGEGTTVVLSSHDMNQVAELCDAATVVHRGRVVFDGTLEAMRDHAPDPAWRLQTSDDRAALDAAAGAPVVVGPAAGDGLTVRAAPADLDAYVIGLGRAGVAVRALQVEVTPLEALFFALTDDPGPTP